MTDAAGEVCWKKEEEEEEEVGEGVNAREEKRRRDFQRNAEGLKVGGRRGGRSKCTQLIL